MLTSLFRIDSFVPLAVGCVSAIAAEPLAVTGCSVCSVAELKVGMLKPDSLGIAPNWGGASLIVPSLRARAVLEEIDISR